MNILKKTPHLPLELYSVENYSKANSDFIKNNAIKFSTIPELAKELRNDQYYHFRIHNNTQYSFFGDLDYYDKPIRTFIELLSDFLKTYYELEFVEEDFLYTRNNVNKHSYHYVIPKWNASTEKLKEIHTNLIKTYPDILIKKIDKDTKHLVDTSIYSEHWFRCPYQTKGSGEKNNIHVIKKGKLKDHIPMNISRHSTNINDVPFKVPFEQKITCPSSDEIIIVPDKVRNTIPSENQITCTGNGYATNQIVLTKTLAEPTLYKKIFDECYKQHRFETWNYWVDIGMALYNIFSDEDTAFDLFNYYSAKGSNYDGVEATRKKIKTFIKRDDGKKVGTIYYYAVEDNKPKFIEIMNRNSIELEQTDICKYIQMLAGCRFIYIKSGSLYTLYCYNGKYWQTDDVLLRQFISTDLYEFIKFLLTEVYWESRDFNKLKSNLNRLKYIKYKKDIIETYKEYGCRNDVRFDDKWHLLGFNNMVYDLLEESFRNYEYDDYISTTTGYDWKEPTEEEIMTIRNLIEQIMPIQEERELYLQILCTALDGRCIEHFIVFNGSGGNGKGMLNDLLLAAIGNYGLLGNNSILFETGRTGSNPEKANMHKKRLVIFREPPAKNKFENSVVKELTGGGRFSARTHHEKDTEKELNLTMIVECNQKPLFAEEPRDSEVRRIIDIYFRSRFTTDQSILDDQTHVFKADPKYKTTEFQEKHKCALLKILFGEYKKFRHNNYILSIPESVRNRTLSYLELSCNIVQWFKNTYKLNKNSKDILKIKDIFNRFTQSEYYFNLSKMDKRKYNKAYFQNYVKENIFFRQYYCEKSNNLRNFIKHWELKNADDSDND